MIRQSAKVSNAPPVPPRPSKTLVAEALAKSRKISPVRVLYATQPISSNLFKDNSVNGVGVSNGVDRGVVNGTVGVGVNNSVNKNIKPVVPVRTAPPPPVIKPRPQPQIMKSYSSASVPQNQEIKISRSISDCNDINANNSRTIIYQSSNKTSKIDVNLTKKNSFKTNANNKIENSKNEKNKNPKDHEPKFCSSAEIKLSNTIVEINRNCDNNDKFLDNTKIIQSNDKTMITVSSSQDDNNNKSVEQHNGTILFIGTKPEIVKNFVGNSPKIFGEPKASGIEPKTVEIERKKSGELKSSRSEIKNSDNDVKSFENGIMSARDGVRTSGDGLRISTDGIKSPDHSEVELRSEREGIRTTTAGIRTSREGKRTSAEGIIILREDNTTEGILNSKVGIRNSAEGIRAFVEGIKPSGDGSNNSEVKIKASERTTTSNEGGKASEAVTGFDIKSPTQIENKIHEIKSNISDSTVETSDLKSNERESKTSRIRSRILEMESKTEAKNPRILSVDYKSTGIETKPSIIDSKSMMIDSTISEIYSKTTAFESKNEPKISNESKTSTIESKKSVKFDDKINHEILIQELENMRKEQERLLKRQRKPFKELYDTDDEINSKISHSDWVEVTNGEEIRLSSCQIFINENDDFNAKKIDSKFFDDLNSDFDDCVDDKFVSHSRIISRNMSLHGLPPLPKSLSGFNLLDNGHRTDSTSRNTYNRVPASPGPQTPSRASSSRGPTPPTPGSGTGHVVYPPHPRLNGSTGQRKPTNLDMQLAILRREMYGLRQLDLTLLSQLYSLNEAIQDFRQMLQEQEDTAFSPHSPSPSPSSGDEVDDFYTPQQIRFKPTGPTRRTSNSSSAASSEYGTV